MAEKNVPLFQDIMTTRLVIERIEWLLLELTFHYDFAEELKQDEI